MSIEMEIYFYLITTFIIVLYTVLLQYKLWKKETELEFYKERVEKEIAHRVILEKIFNPDEEMKKNIENQINNILSSKK